MRAAIHRRRRTARALYAALGAALLACSEPQPEAAWPQGALLSADGPALAGLLDTLARLERTPLARVAAELRAKLPACAQLEAHAPDGDPRALLASLRCADASGPLAAYHAARGDADLAFALPGEPARRIHGAAHLAGAAPRLALVWPVLEGPLAGLLPGDAPAGAERLARAERVAHATSRAAGPLDLAALVPEGSQGDRMFRLRSELFGAAVLDGQLELALYLPAAGAAMPRIAAALGVRHAGLAQAAVERFLDEVETTWRLRREPFEHASAHGSCLPDLHLVPELAPCYALTGSALVFGWNPASLRHALASGSGAAGAEPAPAAARLEIDLAGVAAADARLSARHGDESPAVRWPWRRMRAEATRIRDALEIVLDLEPASAS